MNTKDLTPEQIPEALARAQNAYSDAGYWFFPKGVVTPISIYNPLTNNNQYNELTLDPEIHAGMIDVLDEWISESWLVRPDGEQIPPVPYHHNPEYLQDIRLWQLRACVEYLRRENGTQTR